MLPLIGRYSDNYIKLKNVHLYLTRVFMDNVLTLVNEAGMV